MADKESLLIAAIEQHEGLAESHSLHEDRADALDYYKGEPLGNEVAGRSQVVYRSVFDTVEWIKPQLADVFTSGEEIVSFAPRGPEDVQGAAQETDYTNHIITQRNPWFEICLTWFHDALVQKVGYVKAYWDDSKDTITERYEGLTGDEYAMLLQDKDIVEVEHEELPGEYVMGVGYQDVRHNVSVERSKPENVVRIENIAPESVRVSKNARRLSLQDRRVDFVQHVETKTISELREDGFKVDDDITDGGEHAADWEEALRDEDNPLRDFDSSAVDPSMRRVRVRETWIRYDKNGDGRAELLHCIVVGTTLLHCEETDHIPLIALCPTPLSHQHHGLSVADAVMDLQRIQTALLRGGLDNQYLANNGRFAVDESNVNLDDMLDSRPGGIVRVSGQPGAAILPLTHPTNGQVTIPMMEYVDKIAQRRTGVSEMSQGLDPSALNNQAGANANAQMMTAAQQRVRFIAKVFAEMGVRNLFGIVHMLSLKHSRQQEMVELRGQWVPVNPRNWVKRKDMNVTLTLGAGDKPQQIMMLQAIGQAQKEGLMIGLAKPQNLYNTAVRLTKLMGHRDVDSFWVNPGDAPMQPPKDPKVTVEEMRLTADAQKFQAQTQAQIDLETLKAQAKLQETQAQLELQAANDARDSERETLKAQYDHQLAQMQLQMDKYKTDQDNRTRLLIARMGQETSDGKEPTIGEDGVEMTDPPDRLELLSQEITRLAQTITSPKQIVRDEAGRVVGVVSAAGAQAVVRDEQGRAVGVSPVGGGE